ncbi:MAG: hypothetical protein FVQ85_14515 [Planctomycetes bacterium]|nr:hypothetical protein [Planctomycetota bacterium]
MSRKNDVAAILKAASEQHKEIKAKYDDALRNKSMDLKIPVKNLMENLRSSLDYMAHDIYEACCKPSRSASAQPDPKNIYFPYAKTEQDFRSHVGAVLPGLQSQSVAVYDLLLSIQPFKCNNTWLYDLCSVLNENKHERLVPQERKETETYSVKGQHGSVTIRRGPGSSVTSKPGAVKTFGVPAQFMGDAIASDPRGGLDHVITRWVSFMFEGTNINVLGLLNKSVATIQEFVDELYKNIS